MSNIIIKRLTGQEILPFIPALAELRITVFREFPYLYDGSHHYEEKYLKRYTKSDKTVVVVVLDGEKVVGASTGMPLSDEDAAVRKPFEILMQTGKLSETILNSETSGDQSQYELNLLNIYYFGESVLLKDYRGMGFGVRFFEERELHAVGLGYSITTFCAVDRTPNHPLKPASYIPLHDFWIKRGYRCLTGVQSVFKWKDLNESQESDKTLTFWVKRHQ